MEEKPLTGKQRFLAALARREPDMVPIWELGINEPSICNIARLFTEDVPEPKLVHELEPMELLKLMNTLKLVIEALDLDGMTSPVFTGREAVGENLVRDKLGVVSRVSTHGEPVPVEGPIGSMSDLEAFRMPEPDPTWVMGVQYARSQFGDRRAAVIDLQGPFRLSWGLRGGMTALLMDFALQPELVHALCRLTTDYCLQIVELAFNAGADAMLLNGDLAMNENTLFSPAQYREFIKPYHKEIVDAVHARGAPVAKHSDGNFWPILDDMIEIGFDGFHPIQPQSMDIAEVKAHLGGRAAVMGNIDVIELLPNGTEAEVEQAVRDTMAAAAPGGGYILSSSNSIFPEVKPENVVAMFGAARKYGRYPIRV